MSRTRNPRATRAGFREAGEPWLESKSCGQSPGRPGAKHKRSTGPESGRAVWEREGGRVVGAGLGPLSTRLSVALEAQSLGVPKPEPSRVTSGLGVRPDPCNPLPAPPPRFRSLRDAPYPSPHSLEPTDQSRGGGPAGRGGSGGPRRGEQAS